MDFTHASNAAVLSLLRHERIVHPPVSFTTARSGAMLSEDPDRIERAAERVGTHFDLVSFLWDELPATLPERCRWIVHSRPVLVHPRGIVFAFALGTLGYGLRLPPRVHTEYYDSATRMDLRQRIRALFGSAPAAYTNRSLGGQPPIDIAALGDDWVVGRFTPLKQEQRWCCASYDHAASIGRMGSGVAE